jgi:hypothetical protein
MTDNDDIGRGDRLWLQPADQKVAKPFALIRDVVLGDDGRPACLVATMNHGGGDQETIIITLERQCHG